MSLLFNMLSRLVITFLIRSKSLLISWLQSQPAVILEPKKITSAFFPLFPLLFALKWWDRKQRAAAQCRRQQGQPALSRHSKPAEGGLHYPDKTNSCSRLHRSFASGGQSTGLSASKSVLPMNFQDWSPLGWTGWISLQSKGLSNTTIQKHQFSGAQLSLWSSSHIHTWLLEKTIALTRWTFVGKVMSLIFNMLSRLVIALVPRNKCLLISWLQ